jgi:hypothetical protein
LSNAHLLQKYRDAIVIQNDDFLAYAHPQLDLLAMFVSSVIHPMFLTSVVLGDRVFFSSPGRETFGLPSFGLSATATVTNRLEIFDIGKLQATLQNVRTIRARDRNWLISLADLYLLALREPDTVKQFLWGFVVLEQISSNLHSDLFKSVMSDLQITLANRSDLGNMPLPPSLVLSPDHQAYPLNTRFTIVALALSPETAIADAAKFTEANRARNDLAHRGIRDVAEQYNDTVRELLDRYVKSTIAHMLGT